MEEIGDDFSDGFLVVDEGFEDFHSPSLISLKGRGMFIIVFNGMISSVVKYTMYYMILFITLKKIISIIPFPDLSLDAIVSNRLIFYPTQKERSYQRQKQEITLSHQNKPFDLLHKHQYEKTGFLLIISPQS